MTPDTRTVLTRLCLVALLSLYGLCAQALPEDEPEALGFSGDRLDRLPRVLQEYVEDGQLAGGVVLVARQGRIAHHSAFGYRDIGASDPMASDDLFRIASQTKAIISVAVMMLQEQGELLITDPVHHYLPEFAETTVAVPDGGGSYTVVPAERQITIRDLLTHTSGVSYGSGPAAELWADAGLQGWYTAHLEEPVRETVRRMAALPFDAQPGERWVYGYNTDILGALIEVVSGQSLDRFLHDRIFAPLDMNDTRFFLTTEAQRDRLVTVYSSGENGVVRAPDESRMQAQGGYAAGPQQNFSGGAGLVSTALDYARFLQMLLNGGELDGARLLSPKTVQLMTANHVGELSHFYPGNGFGLGFSIRQDLGSAGTPGTPGEFSWLGAYHSIYWVDPVENLLVVYLTQLIPARDIDDFGKLRTLVYQAITDSHVNE